MSTVLSGLIGLAGTAGTAAVATALLHRPRPYLPDGHALPGPHHGDPLAAALRHRFGGVTVPVRPGPRGELFLGLGEPQPGRTLRRLVLRPLAARLAAGGGRLHPAQRAPFALVVEFGGPDRDPTTLLRAYRTLHRELRDHAPMLTRYTAGRLARGAVTVTVAGILDVRSMVAAQSERYAFADGTFDDIGSTAAPPSVVPAVADLWTRRFGWDGLEPFCPEERHLLHGLVATAHAEGRTVRIGGVPARPRRLRAAFWAELRAAGVDGIADPDLPRLARHLRADPRARRSDGDALTGLRQLSVAPRTRSVRAG